MPTKGLILRVVAMHTPMTEPPLVSRATTWELKAESKHHKKH